MKQFLIFCLAFFACVTVDAQFVFGWSGGYAPTRELNREIYVYNQINSGLDKEMGEVHWYQGPLVGFRSPGEGPFFELLYSRKRAKVESEWDSAGVTMTRQMKTLCNTWNFGFGYQSEKWRFGVSVDAGRFKGFGRRGAKDGIGDMKWQRIWVVDNTRLVGIAVYRLYLAETIFVERKFGLMNLRLYAQLPGTKSNLDRLDEWMFGGDINYGVDQEQAFVNVGMALSIQIGGN